MEAGTAARLLVTLFIFSCTTFAAETTPQAKQNTAADIVYRNGFIYPEDYLPLTFERSNIFL
ncbi:MAG: hypothetical protein BMS9Abin11_1721 [Gammaproteobacteria bacterium]|nr:MAG: hypothetical protein BMS9Abin11_1721 [Gammaproteobacteria bacterium]